MSAALAAPPPRRLGPRLKPILWICGLALLVHLIPLFLPRNVPGVELELASQVPDPQFRLRYLTPLLSNPKATAEHLREAAVLALPASTKSAESFLQEAQRRAPNEVVENELLRARICDNESERACVRDALEKARAAAPRDARPDLLEEEFARAHGDMDRALVTLGMAYQKERSDAELALRYARALGSAGRHEDAEQIFGTLHGRLPTLRLLVEHGLLELAQGENQNALEDFLKASQADPNGGEPRYYSGVALFRLGQWPKAEAALREADTLNPSDFRALALLCAIQREDGRMDEAASTRAMLDQRMPTLRSQYEEACPP